MTQDTIRSAVVEALHELLDGPPVTVNDETIPITNLGLCSEDGLDFACIISEKLDFHLDDKVNPFINDAGNIALNIQQITALVSSLVPKKAEVTNA